MKWPSITVQIAQFGSTELTPRCIDAVERCSYEGDVEVLVLDNGSPSGVGAVGLRPDIRLIELDTNVGFGCAHNQMAELASGEFLLILNNDALLTPGSLTALVTTYQSHQPTPGTVLPHFLGFGGRTLELGSFLGPAGGGWQQCRDARPAPALLERPFVAHYGSAAAMLVAKDLFRQVDGFDELFRPAYYEDTDLCLRLAQLGYPTVIEPRARVFHFEGGTAGRSETEGPKRFMARNRTRLVSRWRDRLATLPSLSVGTTLSHTLGIDSRRRPAILWIHPELLRPDATGGDARVAKEIEVLRGGGYQVVFWCEHTGDRGMSSLWLRQEGIPVFGYREPSRWPLGTVASPSLRSLQELLQLVAWEAVVVWSAELAHRVLPLVREYAPSTTLLIDNGVLLYLQADRGKKAGASLPSSIQATQDWELSIYRRADGIIASSRLEAKLIQDELPNAEVFSFDVGAYEPIPSVQDRKSGPLVFLGNFAHPPNLDAVKFWCREIAPLVEELAGRTIPLRIIGTGSNHLFDGSPPPSVEVAGWVKDLGSEFCKARACLVPLRYGAGTKDKISVACRYGLPTITTPTGAESMPDPIREALVVRESPRELAEAIVDVMTNDQHFQSTADRTSAAALVGWQQQVQSRRQLLDWLQGLTGGGPCLETEPW